MNSGPIKFTKKDFDETDRVAELLKKIDHIDATYADTVLDEIFQRQPFFLSALLGHKFDVSMVEWDEIIKIYILIWQYLRSSPNVQKKQVTKAYFEKIQIRNIEMLKYLEGEPTEDKKLKVQVADLQKLKSKALWTAILFRCEHRPVLKNMDIRMKAMILVGMKSFIECFETI